VQLQNWSQAISELSEINATFTRSTGKPSN